MNKLTIATAIMLLLLFGQAGKVFCQQNVGIGTTTPDPSARLDIVSTSQGILVSRLNTAQRLAIPSPANSLLVYDTDSSCFFYWNSTSWKSLCVSASSGAVGPTGLPGATGATGTNGIDGATGATGATGPTGVGIPVGGIIMWSGLISAIPAGWALCDGTSGTPNLSDKFILGVSSALEDPGATGGAHSYTLTIPNLPAHDHDMAHTHTINDPGHSHSVPGDDTYSGGGYTFETDDNNNYQPVNTAVATTGITINPITGNTGLTGGGAPFDNRPAFFKLAYIIKL